MVPPTPDDPGSPYDRKKLYRRIHDRLATSGVFSKVRYAPSRIRPRRVVADVDPAAFVDPSYPASETPLEIEFLFRSAWNHYWIQWIEPDGGVSCGWHQNDTYQDLGRCHFQVERSDGSTVRHSAEYLDDHPLQVVERRLQALPERLAIDGS